MHRWLMFYWCLLFTLDLSHSRAEHDAIKQQAESTNREYDRLMKEHTNLQVCVRCAYVYGLQSHVTL